MLHCGQTGTHFVVRYHIDFENLCSNSYFAVTQKTDLLLEAVPFFPSTQARHSERSSEH